MPPDVCQFWILCVVWYGFIGIQLKSNFIQTTNSNLLLIHIFIILLFLFIFLTYLFIYPTNRKCYFSRAHARHFVSKRSVIVSRSRHSMAHNEILIISRFFCWLFAVCVGHEAECDLISSLVGSAYRFVLYHATCETVRLIPFGWEATKKSWENREHTIRRNAMAILSSPINDIHIDD